MATDPSTTPQNDAAPPSKSRGGKNQLSVDAVSAVSRKSGKKSKREAGAKVPKSSRPSAKKQGARKTPALTPKQVAFLEALPRCNYNLSKAAQEAGVSRRMVYKWIDTKPAFKETMVDAREARFDAVEGALHQRAVKAGDVTALIFLAKTLLKHRGYIEGHKTHVVDTGPELAAVIDLLAAGELTVEAAALRLTKAGIPLPRTLEIMLAREKPSEEDNYPEGLTAEEFERKAMEAMAEIEHQREHFLPTRQAEVAAMKEELKAKDSWSPEALGDKEGS